MVPEVTLDAKGVIRACRIAFRAGLTIKINGGVGGGKTEMLTQLAQELEAEAEGEPFFFTSYVASMALGPDLLGFLLPFERKHTTFDGKETFTLREGAYTYPYFLRDIRTGEPIIKFTHGLVVIDEWDKAPADVKKILTPLIWEYRLGEHKVPRTIHFVLLGNRAKDRSGSTKEYDYSINRWVEVNYQPSVEGFNAHFRKPEKKLQSEISEWVNNGENFDIFSGEPPEKQGPWATSRSVETMSKLLYSAETYGVNETDHVAFALLAGAVGVGKAASFKDSRAMGHMLPTYDEVVKNPLKAKVPADTKENVSAFFVIVHRLAGKIQYKDAERVVEYIKRLPKSFGVAFIKVAMDRDPDLFLNEHVAKWSHENGDVLAAINKFQAQSKS